MIGRTLSHYTIQEKLGEGGMGVVYLAEDVKLGRQVALKLLPPELTRDSKAKARFIQEARAASAIEHGNICTIYEIDETPEGQIFICMAYYRGRTLKERMEEGPVGIAETVDIATQAAHGLSKAHAEGIVHRDIKPANIFITDDHEVKILDFGLAKLAGQLKMTTTGKTMGTVSYMSPEQGRGEEVGPATDVWALGVVIYEMLTGRLPFRGEYEVAMLYSILNETPEPIASLRPETPEELGRIVGRAMERDSGRRYVHAKEMFADLSALHQQITFAEYTVPRLDGAKRKRKSLPLVASVIAALALMTVTAWIFSRRDGGRIPGPPGKPFQVTSGDAWESEPALSPDGGRIAYTSNVSGNSDIFVVDVRGGNPLQLTDDPARDRYPAWVPDGSAIVFVSDRGGADGIWKTGQFGGGATLVAENAVDPDLSPDGLRLACSVSAPDGGMRIAVVDLSDPRDPRILTVEADGLWNHTEPAWSPGGRTICYASQNELWIVPFPEGKARPLTTGGRRDRQPAWSSDGRTVYFASAREGTAALWSVPSSGGEPVRYSMGSGFEQDPSISRDGRRLAYATRTAFNTLLVRDLVSGRESPLSAHQDDYMAAISPDGSSIVCASARGGRGFDLWLQPLDRGTPDGAPRRLTEFEEDVSHPVFSPDGRWIAFYRVMADEQRDIWILPSAGGQAVRFTDDPAADIHPAWSPDGTRLVFVSERDGEPALWAAGFAEGRRTTEPEKITSDRIKAFFPVWSPDGGEIAFVGFNAEQAEVWTVVPGDPPRERKVTDGSGVRRIRWDPRGEGLLVSGTWKRDTYALRRVDPSTGASEPVDPPLLFGSQSAAAIFDVTADGRYIVFSREIVRGNIWVVEATERVF